MSRGNPLKGRFLTCPRNVIAFGYPILISLGILLATGCSTPSPVQRQAVFSQDEYAPYRQPGHAHICGAAFLQSQNGTTKYATGQTIYVKPVTTYSSEWFHHQVLNDRPLAPPEPRAAQYQWTTTAGENGQFCIKGLPEGAYYVATDIPWKFVWLYDAYDAGEWVGIQTNVGPGEHVTVTLQKDLEFENGETITRSSPSLSHQEDQR